MGTTIDEIIDSLRRGQGKRVRDLVNMALDEGESYQTILKEGFLNGMEQITDRFREEEVGVPEILSITRALDQGISALNSYTGRRPARELGPVVLGTVNGGVHDIGKNLVKLMMQSKDIQVVDLGVNISPQKFLDETIACKAKVVCLSGILPGSAEDMQAVIDEFQIKGIRDRIYVMVGGYGLNEAKARKIGADCFTMDARNCAEQAYRYLMKCERRRKKAMNSRKEA